MHISAIMPARKVRFALLAGVLFAVSTPLVAQNGDQSTPPPGPGGNPNANVPYSPQGSPSSAQAPPTHATPLDAAGKLAAYGGCVQRSAAHRSTLVLDTPTLCAVLTGKLATRRLAGREINIQGILDPGSAKSPASIQIDYITDIGKRCSARCSPKGIGR